MSVHVADLAVLYERSNEDWMVWCIVVVNKRAGRQLG